MGGPLPGVDLPYVALAPSIRRRTKGLNMAKSNYIDANRYFQVHGKVALRVISLEESYGAKSHYLAIKGSAPQVQLDEPPFGSRAA